MTPTPNARPNLAEAVAATHQNEFGASSRTTNDHTPPPPRASTHTTNGSTPPPDESPPDFSQALLSARNLQALEIEQRPRLLGEWMREGDLGYLFAPRGGGKTWLAMLIGNAVSEGARLGEWERGDSAREVFYFDAEMNLADVKDRAGKVGITAERFQLLSNEMLFSLAGHGVNIAKPSHQAGLSAMLSEGSLFIIDNLSTAQLGMSENDNDSFDAIRDWLLSLRHRRITVLIVHHAGRNGEMRGSSRREDMAHWIIKLKDDSDDDGRMKAFTTAFSKCRNCRAEEAPPMKWTLQNQGETITYTCAIHNGPDAMLGHIQDGVGSASELAELLGVAVGTVSKWARKLMGAGKIEKAGREYKPIEWPI